jgi:hypothetical protein
MPGGPPRILERIIGLFIPPSRREDVLGDLRERYASLWRYIAESIRTTPMVIFGAIRRTTEPQLLLMEALLLYISFLSALWYMNRPMLDDQWGLLRPAIPAAIAVAILLLYDAWAPPEKFAPFRGAVRVVVALGIACLCQIAALPREVALFGAGIAALLVSTVRMLFLPGAGLQHRTVGPEQAPQKISAPAELSKNARRLRDAGVTALFLAFFVLALRYGGMPLMIIAVLGAVVYQFKRHSWRG